jgi:hypothetical protein
MCVLVPAAVVPPLGSDDLTFVCVAAPNVLPGESEPAQDLGCYPNYEHEQQDAEPLSKVLFAGGDGGECDLDQDLSRAYEPVNGRNLSAASSCLRAMLLT